MNPKSSSLRQWSIAALIIVGLVIVGFLTLRKPQPAVSLTTTITNAPMVIIGADGQASIGGVTIRDTNVRDAAFRVLATSDSQRGIAIGAHAFTNDQQASNIIATLNAAARTGLLPPAPTNAPSPFE